MERVHYRRVSPPRGANPKPSPDLSKMETLILQCMLSGIILVIVLLVNFIAPLQNLRHTLLQALSGPQTPAQLVSEIRAFGEEYSYAPYYVPENILIPTYPLYIPQYEQPAYEESAIPITWLSPANGRVSSPAGIRQNPITGSREFHDGIDIALPMDTPIVAPKDGEVIASGYSDSFGRFLRIAHDNDYVTFYAHLNRAVAGVGEMVTQGETVAYSGNTGMSTGPHLHFSIFHQGQFVDPLTRVTPTA